MRKNLIVSIFDSKSNQWTPLQEQSPYREEIIRSLVEQLRDPRLERALINVYPADFTVFILGERDPFTGRVELYDSPESLGTITQLRAQLTAETQ